MSGNVLTVTDLKKTYRRGVSAQSVQALKGISFEIKAGKVTGFLGANGAGKTTTIKCLLGLAFPDSGAIRYFDSHGLSNDVKKRMGFLPERPYFYEYLTGREFLRFYGEISTDLHRQLLIERVDRLLNRVGLSHASDRQLRSYSKGMLQRIGIAQTLIHEPEFIILDEPMTGLDPDGRFEVREIIRETAKAGTAVFFSSHLLPDAEELCDNLVILKQGEVVFHGATRELLEKVETRFELTASKSGQVQSQVLGSVGEVQASIDKLRGEGAEILEIKPNRQTLEQAFVRIAFDGKEGRL